MNKFISVLAIVAITLSTLAMVKLNSFETEHTDKIYSQENLERVLDAAYQDYLEYKEDYASKPVEVVPAIKVVPPTVKVIPKVQVPEKEVMCMQFNIYHESRGEPVQGQIGTGWVTINRVQHRSFGDTPCEVVYAAKHDSNGVPIRKKCQFEWYCDGKSDVPNLGNKMEREAWEDAGKLARQLVENCVVSKTHKCPPDPTNGALFFRSAGIQLTDPYYIPTAVIGEHRYYAIR